MVVHCDTIITMTLNQPTPPWHSGVPNWLQILASNPLGITLTFILNSKQHVIKNPLAVNTLTWHPVGPQTVEIYTMSKVVNTSAYIVPVVVSSDVICL